MRGETALRTTFSRADGYFNPLPSCEGRRQKMLTLFGLHDFNPLPSCEGRHYKRFWIALPHQYFNPLPSCEGRPGRYCRKIQERLFQSTPLMRGETAQIIGGYRDAIISIHSPHARGDYTHSLPCSVPLHFNPLPSCGVE